MSIKESMPYKKVRRLYHALRQWETTKDRLKTTWKLRPYRNRHRGQKCVIVGNGPSLRAEDLSALYRLRIPTFGCNRIHLIFPQTEWRPTYYFISDEKLIAQYEDDIEGVPVEHRFFPKRYRDRVKNGRFYNELEFNFEKEGKFSLDAGKGVYPAGSVTTEMIQFAYYMGFSEIYLIGVDFSYAVTQKLDSRTYSYQGENNYFIPGYLKQGEVADMPNVRANLLGFNAAKEAIEANGRSIYNATRGGKLEVFKRADLDELLKKWEAGQQ